MHIWYTFSNIYLTGNENFIFQGAEIPDTSDLCFSAVILLSSDAYQC